MVTITDEFGRDRAIPASEARSLVGIQVNLKDDFKEYGEHERIGFHMFPPTHALSALEKQNRLDDSKDELKGIGGPRR